jgi:hypothetical protein
MATIDPRLALLLDGLDEAFERHSWHGTNLRGSLRGVTAEAAAWRLGPKRHNIWEVAVHAAYWKYVIWRKLTGAARGSFQLDGSNWFTRPAPGTRGLTTSWAADADLLLTQHKLLREAVEALDPDTLARPMPKSLYSPAYFVRGAAAHDLYHAGQIQLLKRLRMRR